MNMYTFLQRGALPILFLDSSNRVSLHDFPNDGTKYMGGKCCTRANLGSIGKDLYIESFTNIHLSHLMERID